MILTTSEDSFNIFRPNLDPDFDENDNKKEMEEKKQSEDAPIKKAAEFYQSDDEDVEAEE